MGVVIGLMGCGDGLPGPEPGMEDVPIRTDRLSYEAEWDGVSGPVASYHFHLVATYENRTDRTVYLGQCSPTSPIPIYGVRMADPEDPRESAYNPGWGCVGHDEHFAVEPGAIRVDTLRIRGPHFWDGATQEPIGVLEGRFRLRYDVRLCSGDCRDRAPESERLSNAFEVSISR